MASSANIARQRAVEAALQRNNRSNDRSNPRYSDAAHSLTVFVVGCPGAGSTSQCVAITSHQATNQSIDHVEFDRVLEHVIRLAEQKEKKKSSTLPTSQSSKQSSSPSTNPLINQFTPNLSSSSWKSLLRCHERGEPISSSIRARILYDWIEQSNKPANLKPNTQKSHVYLVDGYLHSQDDWNEWAALIKKRSKEQAKASKQSNDASVDERTKLGFLPPVVVRLVCSESVGQLRWRRQVLVQNDASNSSSGSQAITETINQIKARSMRYSLMTRPLIYRLGIQSQEVRRIGVDKSMTSSINQSIQVSVSQSVNHSTQDDGEASSDSDPDEEVGLTLIDGTVVKRVDAECPIDQCFKLFESLIRDILDVYYRTFNQDMNQSGEIEHPWDEVEGYESDPEEEESATEQEVELPPVNASISQPIDQSVYRTMDSQPGAGLTIDSRLANVTLNQPINQYDDGDISPSVINWKDDPVEDLNSSDREFEEMAERNARLMKLIEQEEERWHKAQVREETREVKKLEEQINRIKEKTNEVVAEPGQIPTRKDDRFVTFISFMISLTLQSIPNPKDDSSLMVEIFRGFEHNTNQPNDNPSNNQIRWIPVIRTAPMPCPHTAGIPIHFPRVLANTWRLSGNERERPIMFRLVSANQSNNTKLILAESRTNLQHLINPPEAAGLTLAFNKYVPNVKSANPVSSIPLGFVICSRAALHTLLKASKIIPPEKLAALNQTRPVIPTAIPITPSNMVTPAHSKNASPVISPAESPAISPMTSPKARKPAVSSPPPPSADPSVSESVTTSANSPADSSARSHKSSSSERPTTRTRSSTAHNAERPSSSRHRSHQQSSNQVDDEADRILRELDQQIGITRRRAASFDGAQSSRQQSATATDNQNQPSQPSVQQLPVQHTPQPIQQPSHNALVPAPIGQSGVPPAAETAEAAHRRLARRKVRESKAEAERRQLVEMRRKRAKAEAREMQSRAIEREKRRTELARLKKKAAVQRVSMLAIESAALNLPKQGMFAHDRFYLQVYRKRDKIKEKERAAKALRPVAASKKGSISQPIDASGARADGRKMADTLPADSRNFCIKASHRHFLKPSLFSLVYSSPVYSSLNPIFSQFAIPIDDQPLLFVLVASSCSHKIGESARYAEHDGKDRIIGVARLAMSDMVNIAAIQQREWDVEIYAMVEREREKERARERAAAQVSSSNGADAFEELAEVEAIDTEKLAQKNRVAVILKEPKQLEREKEARAQRKAERKRRAAATDNASSNMDDDDSDDSGDEAGSTVADAAVNVPMLAFFALSFFSTRPIDKNGGLVQWTREEEAKRNELIREQRARVLGQASKPQSDTTTVRIA